MSYKPKLMCIPSEGHSVYDTGFGLDNILRSGFLDFSIDIIYFIFIFQLLPPTFLHQSVAIIVIHVLIIQLLFGSRNRNWCNHNQGVILPTVAMTKYQFLCIISKHSKIYIVHLKKRLAWENTHLWIGIVTSFLGNQIS